MLYYNMEKAWSTVVLGNSHAIKNRLKKNKRGRVKRFVEKRKEI
jgi:hypothetical protein